MATQSPGIEPALKDLHPADIGDEVEVGDWHYLDVRTPGEFAEARIEGSDNVPLADLGRWAYEIGVAADKKPIALVCRTGRRAREAAKFLAARGIDRLCVLSGGVVAWEEIGLPLLRGKKGMSLERQVRVAAGSLVLCGVALGFLVHPGFFGISGFVGAGLVFAGLSDTCGMAIMLGMMPWNRARSCGLECAE
ncbi:MAG: rhodanese-like domain-containing protein [Planctomycetota bacterium]